ncbi:MAG: 3-ketoacyl-ACP reductase [Planctomycetes bacterium]|nr:3-ketoacyl-ACP reductase [Planctomycetota bacterium]
MSRPVALITGSSRGIGLGIARALSATHDLVINGVRDEPEVAEVLEELKAAGAEVAYAQGDVSSAEGRAGILAKTRDAFGRLDVLVNNAGVAPKKRHDLLEADAEELDWMIGVNCTGPHLLTQGAASWMIEERAEDAERALSIIFVTSISAESATPNRGGYCMAKAASSMSARLFAVRLAEHSIPVYEVRPGIIATDMTAPVKEKYDDFIADGNLLDARWGTPEDIGKSVAALVRGDLPYATGAVITQDGGLGLPRL